MDGKLWDRATEKPLRKETWRRDTLVRAGERQAPKSRIRGEDGNTQSQEERVVSDNNTDNNNTQDAWRHGATGVIDS